MGCYDHEFRHALHFLSVIDGHIKIATKYFVNVFTITYGHPLPRD